MIQKLLRRASPTRLMAAVLLWAPIFLWLVAWSPPADSLRLHGATATALALISAEILHLRFSLPIAIPSPGRFRVLPASPGRPALTAAVGLSSMGWGAWRAHTLGDGVALLVLAMGGLALWLAGRWRRDPLWGTWLEVADEVLSVHSPAQGVWRVPLGYALVLHRRPQDGSFLLETPWPERDVFAPSPLSHARYHISDHQQLFQRIAAVVPVTETPMLGAVLRRRAARRAKSA